MSQETAFRHLTNKSFTEKHRKYDDEELRKLYALCDMDKNGYLSKSEWTLMLNTAKKGYFQKTTAESLCGKH